jgi:multidrug resistance efflux pump
MLQDSLCALKDILFKIDQAAFEAAIEQAESKKVDKTLRISQPAEERAKLDQKWKSFTNVAKSKNNKFTEPLIPFRDDAVLCEFNAVYKNIYDKEKYLNS